MKEVKYIPLDLVKADKNPNIIWKVKDVSQDKCGNILYRVVAAEDNDAFIYLYEHHIASVPLTPEILEKNGWKKKVMSRGILNSHWVYTKPDIEEYGYFPIYIEKGIGKEFDVYPFTYNKSCTQITYIKYVHELQHLLFGLGLNSEMEV